MIQYIDVVNGSDTLATVTITGATKANPCVITSSGHGFDNGQWIRITSVGGMTQLNNNVYKTANVAANTFELKDLNGNNIDSSGYGTYTSGGTATQWRKIPVSGITQANPAVVTAKKHGFSNGDLIIIEGVAGMTAVNDICFTVANKTTDTFELSGINSSAYTAYTSGGTVTRPFKNPATLETYRGATASPQNSFWVNGDTVKIARTFKYADIQVGSGSIVFTKNSNTVTTSADLRASIATGNYIGLTTARLDGCPSDPTISRPDKFYKVTGISASTITLEVRYGEATTTVSTVNRLRADTEIRNASTADSIPWPTALSGSTVSGAWSFNEAGTITQDLDVGSTAWKPYGAGDYHCIYLTGASTDIYYVNALGFTRGMNLNGSGSKFIKCDSFNNSYFSFYADTAATGASFDYCFGVGAASSYQPIWLTSTSGPTGSTANYCYGMQYGSPYVFNANNYATLNNCVGNQGGILLSTALAKAYNCSVMNVNRTTSHIGVLAYGGAYCEEITVDTCYFGIKSGTQSVYPYFKGGSVSNCTYGSYAEQTDRFTVEDISFTGNTYDYSQDTFSCNTHFIKCQFTTPTTYSITRTIAGGPIYALDCTIDAPSVAKAYQVITGTRYGSPEYCFQNSFGLTGEIFANGSILEDTTEFRTSSPSQKVALSTTVTRTVAPTKLASFFVTGGVAKTYSYYLKRDVGAWSGTITPQLRLNGTLIKTGTSITSLTNSYVEYTLSATSGEIDRDGELSLEFVINANNVPFWIDDVTIS